MGELKFRAEDHTYWLDGVEIPSVTTILKDVGIVNYSAMPNATSEMALHRGSMVHLACQLYDEHDIDESTLDPILKPYLAAWKRFISESGFVIEEIEQRGYNPKWGYVGCLDRKGKLNGMPMVIDLKTSISPKWVRMQLAAYVEFVKFPTVVGRMAVELHADETYKAVPLSAKDHARDFNDFLCCLRIYRLKRETNKTDN